MSFAKIQWDFVQLIRQKLIYMFTEFGDEVLCVSPAAVLPAGVSTSHVCHTAMAAGYSAVHSLAVTVHSRL